MHKLSRSWLLKLAVVLVVAVLAHGPSAYACSTEGCPGPCLALVNDWSFTQGCSDWHAVNGASITTSGGGYASLTPTTGAVYQDIDLTGYDFSSMEMSIWIGGVTGTPGTEFYRLVITTTGAYPLEYVEVFYASDYPSGRYDFPLENHSLSEDTIRVRISRIQGSAPGNTTMTVNGIEMWGFT